MKGWEVKKLGEVVTLEYGKPLPQEDREPNGSNPAYGANGILCRTNKHYHDRPSFIVGRKGSAGEINLTEPKFWPLDVTYFVTFDEQKYDLMFLYHAFHLLDLPSLAKGVKPGINRNDVYELSFAFPPLDEQQRIVAILDEAFAGLAVMRQHAQANIKNARALFDSHLNAIFSQRSEGWVERRLQDVSREFGRGRSRHRPRNDPSLYGGEYPFIQTGDVRGSNHYITEFSQTYNETGLAQSKLWPAGTICVTIAANIAETGILSFDACFPDSVIGIVVDPKKTMNEYVEYLLQSVQARLKAQGKGSAQDNINLGTFENEVFPFPSLSEQAHIVDRLNEAAGVVSQLESIYRQKLAAIDELKQSILHRAFSGELSAKDALAA